MSFNCSGACLIGQYYAAMGIKRMGADKVNYYSDVFKGQSDRLGAYGKICAKEPHTFGAALQRAERLMREGK